MAVNEDIYTPKTWAELYAVYHDLFSQNQDPRGKLWIFRGQRDFNWRLQTSWERTLKRWDLEGTDLKEPDILLEEAAVREFQRRLHASDKDMHFPDLDDVLAWLALMQHYGAPTRLLDWTYSFFVALYFAVESADTDAAVWAINGRECNERARAALGADRERVVKMVWHDPYFSRSDTFRALFARPEPVPLIYRVNSYILNPRIIAQQGLFLCPGDISKPFEDNAVGIGRIGIKIRRELRKDILRELSYMNVGRHSLFPGLEGLAGSLQSGLAFPNRWKAAWRDRRGNEAFNNWLPYQAENSSD